MLWTCSHCGFYNDAAGPCCNCGQGTGFALTDAAVPDLLASTYDPDQVHLGDLDGNTATALKPEKRDSKTANALDLALAFDNADVLLDSVHEPSDDEVSPNDASQQPKDQYMQTQSAQSARLSTNQSSPKAQQEPSRSATQQSPHQPSAHHTTTIRDKQNQQAQTQTQQPSQYGVQSTLHISQDQYQQPTLKYALIEYRFWRILLFYISANIGLTFCTMMMATISTISIVALSLDFEKDSLPDRFADAAAYVLIVSYLLYLVILFPLTPFFYSRGASLWARETPLVNANSFIEWVVSNAPNFTTTQIDTISDHFTSVSNQGTDAIAFVHIPPQFRTRSQVIGIHYIPATPMTASPSHSPLSSSNGNMNQMLLQGQPQSSSSPQPNQQGYSHPYFAQTWSEQPGLLKFLKIMQVIAFFLVIEPILVPLLLSFCGAKKKNYGLKIVKIRGSATASTTQYGSNQTQTMLAVQTSGSNGYTNSV